VGKGRSYETQANLRNLSGDGVLLHEGRFVISDMLPGETKKVAFTFDVEPQLADNEAKVELSIADRDLRETVVEKVKMPLAPALPLTARQGAVKAKAPFATLFETPGGRAFGRLPAGTAVNATATAGDAIKVSLGDNRFGYVLAREVDEGGSAGALSFEDTFQRLPPGIELASVAQVVRDGKVMVRGVVTDNDRLLDAYIFVGARKLFYRSNRTGADPKKMPFEVELPLRPGVNAITVVARENPDTVGRKTIIVRRDGSQGELLQTPKTDDEELGSSGGDD
jgi:carboxyl-terminal processing protease